MNRQLRTLKEKIILAVILLATGGLYWFGASHNGYANSFYSAAIQAGTKSWKAFFFGSLDASNFITVDKPPVSLWPMELSARLFGFHSWSMLLPEVLAGIATVYLVYAAVRRWFSAPSALIAAGVMALTPVAVLMFGFNNPDAILTLLLTASAYATIRALTGTKRAVWWLALAAVMTGLAFNAKMLQGFIALPVLAAAYLFLAPPRVWVRIKHLLIAAVFLAVATLWWPVAVSLTPVDSRPYIGSSTNNSVWNLIMGYNGFGRLLGNSQGGGPGRGDDGAGLPAGLTAATTGQAMTMTPPTGGRGGPGGSGFGGSTGILRMFNSDFGPNIAWFIPLGLIGIGYALWRRRRAARSDPIRTAFIIWGGYALIHIVVFSMTSGTIHPYYPVVMAPAIAALVGMSVPLLVAAYRQRTLAALLLPLAVAATAITATILLGYQTSWQSWLRWMVLASGIAAALLLLVGIIQPVRLLVRTGLILGTIACLAAPTAYSIVTATVVHTGSIPSAGPTGTGMSGSNNETASAETSFVDYLIAHRGSAKWLVAVASANESAPIQLSSGQAVMAVGGFNGSDDALSVDQLKALVASGQLRYYATTSGGRAGGMMGNSSLLSYIQANATTVDYGGTGYTLYDLEGIL